MESRYEVGEPLGGRSNDGLRLTEIACSRPFEFTLTWARVATNSCPKTALRCTNQFRIMVSVEDTSPQSPSPRTQIGQLSGSGICMAREILVCIDVAFVLGIRNSAHLYLGLRYIHTSVRYGWLVGQVRLQLGICRACILGCGCTAALDIFLNYGLVKVR